MRAILSVANPFQSHQNLKQLSQVAVLGLKECLIMFRLTSCLDSRACEREVGGAARCAFHEDGQPARLAMSKQAGAAREGSQVLDQLAGSGAQGLLPGSQSCSVTRPRERPFIRTGREQHLRLLSVSICGTEARGRARGRRDPTGTDHVLEEEEPERAIFPPLPPGSGSPLRELHKTHPSPPCARIDNWARTASQAASSPLIGVNHSRLVSVASGTSTFPDQVGANLEDVGRGRLGRGSGAPRRSALQCGGGAAGRGLGACGEIPRRASSSPGREPAGRFVGKRTRCLHTTRRHASLPRLGLAGRRSRRHPQCARAPPEPGWAGECRGLSVVAMTAAAAAAAAAASRS